MKSRFSTELQKQVIELSGLELAIIKEALEKYECDEKLRGNADLVLLGITNSYWELVKYRE